MSNADVFRSLTQDMANAQKDMANAQKERTTRIAKIGKETAGLLNRFDKEHQAMGRQLRAELAKVKTEIKSDVSILIDD